MGYSSRSKAYRVYNKKTKTIVESINVKFDEGIDEQDTSKSNVEEEKEKDEFEKPKETADARETTTTQEVRRNLDPEKLKYKTDHPPELVIGNPIAGIQTRSSFKNLCDLCLYSGFISEIEPNSIDSALNDENWFMAMQEELNQFERNNVWSLAPRPKDYPVIGTKWIFKNKYDESGNIIRNKARLVAKGYNQIEGVDFDETFAPVARLESIRILLAFACYKGFKLRQMDIKSAFLNGVLKEDVFVEQPEGFESHEYPNHVYKLKKALYGLKQAPRAWYECLTSYLLENGFKKGCVDTTLFLLHENNDILIVQIYVDDIIYGATNKLLYEKFEKVMQEKFEMSLVGELKFFLGFQIQQSNKGTFISQTKYIRELVNKFGLKDAKPARTPMSTTLKLDKDEKGKTVDQKLYRGMIGSLLYLTASRPDIMFSVCLCARFQSNPKESHLKAVKRIIRYLLHTPRFGLWYPSNDNFELKGFSDADYAGNLVDRKSTSGACFMLGHSLVAWSSRK